MEEINISHEQIYSFGYVRCNVPDEIMKTTRHLINDMVNNDFKTSLPYNTHLAGAIRKEFILTGITPLLNKFFSKVIPEYWKLQNIPENTNDKYVINTSNLNEPDVWVNFQERYEFNPIHNHSGALSFVYWVNIPYDLRKEQQRLTTSTSSLKNPLFSFVYTTAEGSITGHDINVDKTYESQMIIFPSWLLHQVTPFYTSDDYRISVAGNLVLDNNG